MQRFAIAIIVVIVIALGSRGARAQMAVFDASTFGQSLATAMHTANQVKQLADQLNNMHEQLRYTMQSLKTLDPSSLASLTSLYNQSVATYSAFQSDAASIGFGVSAVNGNYRRLFARPETIRTAKAADYDSMYGAWQIELQGSTESAMRAQANADLLQKNMMASQRILAASRTADGEVRQLQAIVQMLGVIQAQLTTLTQTISTAARVNTTAAAAAATEKMIAREESRRSLAQYRNVGRPVPVFKKLP
jgi:P-type conjugative transfer protein TrbJ